MKYTLLFLTLSVLMLNGCEEKKPQGAITYRYPKISQVAFVEAVESTIQETDVRILFSKEETGLYILQNQDKQNPIQAYIEVTTEEGDTIVTMEAVQFLHSDAKRISALPKLLTIFQKINQKIGIQPTQIKGVKQ